MSRLSIKWKLTVLYTIFMIILAAGMIGVLFSLSSRQILASVGRTLEHRVLSSFDDITVRNGGLRINSDILQAQDGVYLSVYDGDGILLGGRIPYDFDVTLELEEGLRSLSAGGIRWDVFDASSEIEGYGTVFIRGIMSVTEAENSLRVALRFSMILFPVMVLLMAGLGYFFSSRALRPVSQITKTAREIYDKEDLSKRIGLRHGKDEIYELAGTFDQMLEKLQTSFEREKKFTSDASHELRTPVTVILTQCEYLLEDQELSAEERNAVEVIQRKAQNMANMIAQLLFLSRADQNRQTLQKERLDLSALTEIAAEEQQEIAAHRGIRIETQIEEGVCGEADETLFIRLWMNLIGNAVSYGKENGWIKVRLSEKDGMITGSVQDNGIGIGAEALPHIWERFYQADTSRKDQGSGLGLSMVKWIVEAHGGTIWAESEPGRGTKFEFSFPKKI